MWIIMDHTIPINVNNSTRQQDSVNHELCIKYCWNPHLRGPQAGSLSLSHSLIGGGGSMYRPCWRGINKVYFLATGRRNIVKKFKNKKRKVTVAKMLSRWILWSIECLLMCKYPEMDIIIHVKWKTPMSINNTHSHFLFFSLSLSFSHYIYIYIYTVVFVFHALPCFINNSFRFQIRFDTFHFVRSFQLTWTNVVLCLFICFVLFYFFMLGVYLTSC